MSSLWEDIRYALRLLARQPGFASTAVLLLALGIGANTAIFSLVDSVLLRPLPYKDLDRLSYLWMRDTARGRPPALFSPPEYLDFDGKVAAFSQIAGFLGQPMTVTKAGEPVRVRGAFITYNYLDTLGISLAKGRPFRAEEFESSSNQVVILSDALWRRQFGADPSILGSTITIESEVHVVIGILPPLDTEITETDLYVPLPFTPSLMTARDGRTLVVIAKLKDGATPDQASAELRAVSARVAEAHPESNSGLEAFAVPVMEEARQSATQPLTVLSVAVGLVLLITCANLASLLLVRASGRAKEVAIRTALGASSLRIFRQMLTESMLISILGGAAGLIVAAWCIRAVRNWGSLSWPRLQLAQIGAPVLIFAFLLSIAAGVLCGITPALKMVRLKLARVLGEESRGSSAGRARGLSRSLLVVIEVALSVVLLVAAGLLLRTYTGLTRLDMGFQPAGVLTMRTMLPLSRYTTDEMRARYVRSLLAKLRSLPGVAASGGSGMLPMMSSGWICQFSVDGAPTTVIESADYNSITPGYFDTLSARVIAGRDFAESDDPSAPPVVIISSTLGKRYFPSLDPVGRTITLHFRGVATRATIVGVVHDMSQRRPDEPPRAVIYQSHAQHPWPIFTFSLRTSGLQPQALIPAVRKAAYELDSEIPLDRIQPLSRMVDRSLAQQQLAMVLLACFAVLAILLAAVGLYGVLAVAVAQRAREFGIRSALGATQRDILFEVFRQGLGLTIAGLAAGLIAAPMATYALKQMLYGVTFLDPVTFAAVALLMLSVSAASCFGPARRAARIHPASALRE
ncbi:MAG: ABC transporter permease [Acidobacteria bacterium]|nr:ABC transporter permease [Acidobacteriota bacterium]